MFFTAIKIYSDLYTKRLILREPRMSDTDDIYELCSNSNATQYVDWYPHSDKRQSASYIRYLKRQIAVCDVNSYTWFAEHREDRKVIATISLTELDSSGKIATVGYTFNKKYQHKGYATEALFRIIKYLFEERGIERVQAKVLPQNIPSVRLLERVGMKKEALLRKGVCIKNSLSDVLIYSVLKEEFLASEHNL